MVYRKLGKTNTTPSALGLGTMRLPLKSNSIELDIEDAINVIETAIDQGINYIDTAWPYHKGKSECAVGTVLKNHRREELYIATKSPVWEIDNVNDFMKILNIQLKKLNTDYIDFYLLHALGKNRWEKIIKNEILSALETVKSNGIVRNIGFSFHDEFNVFKKIIDDYNGWDFCQIQYNYRDIDKQAGTLGLEYAASKGLGVIIMEPLKGGELIKLPRQISNIFPSYKSPIEWGLDFLWDKSDVSIVLSGMSTLEQIEENVKYANNSHIGMLSDKERDLYKQAKVLFDTSPMVSCSKCNYCNCCPSNLAIPDLIEAYNWIYSKDYIKAEEYYLHFAIKADSCSSCKICESFCPQKIEISSVMREIVSAFSKPTPRINLEELRLKWPERYNKLIREMK